jgi:DNA-binding transcriptional LysR family regulator
VVVTLQQLRYFLAAVERGSVSGAAEACFVSQPSLSEQLRRLEAGLGVALFVRTNRASPGRWTSAGSWWASASGRRRPCT